LPIPRSRACHHRALKGFGFCHPLGIRDSDILMAIGDKPPWAGGCVKESIPLYGNVKFTPT
jgi:hypothetical protein